MKDPRLTIMGACAMPFLSEHTNAEDWSGGFLGRWFFVHAQRERIDSFPGRGKRKDDLQALANELDRKYHTGNYFCGGLENDAFHLWDSWYKSLDARILPKIITGLKSRAPTHALRVALLLAYDFGITLDREWILTKDLIALAIEITEMYIRSLVSISENLEPDEESRLRKKLLEYLKEVGGIGSLGNFIRIYRTPVATTKLAIEWLCVAGYIQKFVSEGSTKNEGDRYDIIMKLIE